MTVRIFTQELRPPAEPRGLRSFAKLNAGRFWSLSVQASEAHYSRPQKTLDDPNDYTHWEVAMFDKRGKWVNPEKIGVPVPGLDWEGGPFPVGPYVPTAVVQALYSWCMQDGEAA